MQPRLICSIYSPTSGHHLEVCPMAKPEEYDRIKALLQSGLDPSDEEWAWINRYLSIAERAYRNDKPAEQPPAAEPETEKAG